MASFYGRIKGIKPPPQAGGKIDWKIASRFSKCLVIEELSQENHRAGAELPHNEKDEYVH